MSKFRTDYRFTPPKVLVHPYNTGANGSYRQAQPAKALGDAGFATVRIDPHFVSSESLQVMQPDVVVFPSLYTDASLASLARYAKVIPDSFLVYDLDDKLWDVPSHNPAAASLPADIKKRLQKAMGICQRVTVTTPALADAVARELKVPKNKIVVAPNCISKSFVNAARSGFKDRTRTKLRVGWAGGFSHDRDLAILVDTIRATADKYTWVFLGYAPKGVEDLIEFHPAVELADYAAALGALDLDIAVAPLENTPFNACKSALRVLEFGACGYPVLASNVEAFDHSNALRVFSDLDWQSSLELAEPSIFRAEAAEALHQHVLGTYLQEDPNNLETWMDAWLPVGAQMFNPAHPTLPENGDLPGNIKRVDGGYVYTRTGTTAPTDMDFSPGAGFAASVSVISNDGIYPQIGSFVELTPEAADVLPKAAAQGDDYSPVVPQANGPLVFLSDFAVARIGIPDTRRYGMVEAAFIDWSIRAHRAGFSHVLKGDAFAVASKPVQNAELSSYAQKEVVAWTPQDVFERMEKIGERSSPEFATIFRNLDARAFHLSNPPATNGRRVLLINADSEVIEAHKTAGHSVLVSSLFGHYLILDPRFFAHVGEIDLRRDMDDLVNLLARCDISDVVLTGLGEGSVDLLGSVSRLKGYGFNVEYLPAGVEYICPRVDMVADYGPCGMVERTEVAGFDADNFCQSCVNRCGSPYGFVNVASWRGTWRSFLNDVAPTSNEEEPSGD